MEICSKFSPHSTTYGLKGHYKIDSAGNNFRDIRARWLVDILFCQITTFMKVRMAFVFWTSDPLIDGFYINLSIKGSEAQKQRPCKLLWMLWFDRKSISNIHTKIYTMCYLVRGHSYTTVPVKFKHYLIFILNLSIFINFLFFFQASV